MNQTETISVPAAAPDFAPDFGASLVGVSFTDIIRVAENLTLIGGSPMVIDLYRRWIAANAARDGDQVPLFAAWFNVGAECVKIGAFGDSVDAYRQALALRPDFHPASVNLGLSYEALGDPGQALAIWDSKLQTDAARTALLNQKARLSEQTGALSQAEAALRASLLIDPNQPDVIQHWVHVRQKLCRWPVLTDIIPDISEDQLLMQSGPLGALALTDSVELQRDIAAAWVSRKMPPIAGAPLALAQGYRHHKIRVGYLSSDFCRHALCYLIAQLFERHNRDDFEIYGYCSTLDDGSAIRQRVLAGFDHVRFIRSLPDEAAARLIRQDEIDILIDLNGFTAGTRLAVLRHKPAPVQVTYLGFIGPVPLPELDYILADDFVIPAATQHLYSPPPLSIAHIYQANDQGRGIAPQITRAEAGLPPDRVVFCCFSNHYKITEDMFTAWMNILRRVADGVLWLSDDNPTAKQNMSNRARALGVDTERLIFAPRVSPEAYMARLGAADLFLDTFPYNAGTIASDAIRMSLPIVTLMGESFASRMAARFLSALGADEGITTSLDDYIEQACLLALNPDRRANFKAKFGPKPWAASLGDADHFTAEFEATLKRIRLLPDAAA